MPRRTGGIALSAARVSGVIVPSYTSGSGDAEDAAVAAAAAAGVAAAAAAGVAAAAAAGAAAGER